MQFERTLHQKLPLPLAFAYRKAFNSSTGKELNDNAMQFGICLLRLLAALALALARELQIGFGDEERELLAKTDRPSEGHFHQWLVRCLIRFRQRNLPPGSPPAALDELLYLKRDSSRSSLPAAVGHLQSFLQQRQVHRSNSTVHQFLETLIQYRNKVSHGAVLTDELNQQNGQVLLDAVVEVCHLIPFWEQWQMKFVSETSLEGDDVVCRFVELTGPDWLRGPPATYPQGFPVPQRSHLVLYPAARNQSCLDLHPLLVFQNDRVWFFNGASRREVVYLDYYSGESFKSAELLGDYQLWKESILPAGLIHEGVTEADDAAPPAEAELLPATQRFRFDRLLGRGGMGEVWLAHDQTLKRRVAIKRIRRELVGERQVYRRLLQEARDAAALNHPNIVPIHTIDSDDDGPYLVLEYMEGGSLRTRLADGPLPLREALAMLRQLLQALDYAHRQGLIHRDIKPENVLLSGAGVPKLADFGLAWLHEEGLQQDSEAAEGERIGRAAEGTSAYLAPELRAEVEQPGPRTDMYSLGLTFYELLSGGPPQPIREKKIPSAVAALVHKMVYPDPNLRYDSAGAALQDCVELERSLELARRTQAETRQRVDETLQQGFRLLGGGKVVDARACFERVLAEIPTDDGGLTGMLLIQLVNGEMADAAERYGELIRRHAQHPALERIRRFFDSVPDPAELFVTPRPMPYSYLLEELRQGRLVKDLVEYGKQAVNLGDVGELLAELCQQSGGRISFSTVAADHQRLRIELPAIELDAAYQWSVKSSLFGPRKLEGIGLTLRIHGDAFEVYRLVRYLTHNLVRRFKYAPGEWVDTKLAGLLGQDPQAARAGWEALSCRFEDLVREVYCDRQEREV